MTSQLPSISIILPTHNRAPLLGRALRSLRVQTDAEFQVVVIDDGSSDGTPAVLAACDDARILALRNPLAGGAAAARNRAIRAATGDWVCFLDDDDELLPEYVEAVRRQIAADPLLGLIWTGVERCHHDADPPRSEILLWHDRWQGREPCAHRFLQRFALSFGVAARRDLLLDAGLFDERFSATEDIDLAMRLVACGTPYAAIPRPLMRVHAGEGASLSGGGGRYTQRLLLLEKNAAFLAQQPQLAAHYRLFAMSGCYRAGARGPARAQAATLLRSGRIGWRGLEMLLRYEVLAPVRRLFQDGTLPTRHA